MRKPAFSHTGVVLILLALGIGLAATALAQKIRGSSHGAPAASQPSSSVSPDATPPGVPCQESRPPKPPLDGTAHSNYLKLVNFQSVLVTDAGGHSIDPFFEREVGPPPEGVVVDHTGGRAALITAPVKETYTVTFRARDGESGYLQLLRGEDNVSPELALRYKDLRLPKGATAMLKLTPPGVEPLRVDSARAGLRALP
jgi:hypothetical protein